MAVIDDKPLVDSKLGTLGVSSKMLREAIMAGEIERASCTQFHPTCYPGIAAWATATARLAEALATDGWRQREIKNLPLVVHPLKRLAIVVASGNAWTGKPGQTPSTKYPKGPTLRVQVRNNQPSLFDEDPEYVPVNDVDGIVTWLLLFRSEYRPKDGAYFSLITRCELSLPLAIDEEGWVVEWAERIILEPVLLDEVLPSEDQPIEIDVPVDWR